MTTRTILVTYNLTAGKDQYAELFATIEGLGDTKHVPEMLESVWFVKTDKTVEEIDNILTTEFDKSDNWFIVDITGKDHQGMMNEAFWDWFK